ETKPREVWEYIGSLAQAELAVIRTDELDRFTYLPMSYWVETAQQTTADIISTSVNTGPDFAPSRDLTKIRNHVALTYSDTRLGNTVNLHRDTVYLGFTVYTLPPGTTTLTLQFDSPVVSVDYVNDTSGMLLVDGTYTDPPARNFTSA